MTRLRICRLGIFFLFYLGAMMAAPAQDMVFRSMYNFNGSDGSQPEAKLVQATDGNFYGTTMMGGAGGRGACNGSCGTIFKITPAGVWIMLHSFDGFSGSGPYAGLVQAADGYFYGTTIKGGASVTWGSSGFGSVFKISATGTLTTLHSFHGYDGAAPYAGLLQSSDGNLYGTTELGGTSSNCSGGCGTVFKITPSGTLFTLHSFDGSDGANPYGALIQASDGNFYGTVSAGGTNNSGTVFKITPAGTLTTLYSFCASGWPCFDGSSPFASLVQADDGNFYGTTLRGGSYFGDGTVFKITPTGTLTSLYSFCVSGASCADGGLPYAGLVQASDGNFYGTASGGGEGNGTIFEITPTGALTTLFTFHGGDGLWPIGGLTQATDGFFYGTTYAGGFYSYGSVYRLGLIHTCATCRP